MRDSPRDEKKINRLITHHLVSNAHPVTLEIADRRRHGHRISTTGPE
jgi:hypothetical protein